VCCDLSLGAEPVAVRVDSGGAWPAVPYIAECVGGSPATHTRLLAASAAGCTCAPEQCGVSDTCACCVGAPLAYDAGGALMLGKDGGDGSDGNDGGDGGDGKDDGDDASQPIVECSARCACRTGTTLCRNSVVGRGVRVALAVFLTPDGRGWGVRTDEPLRRGTFVCEYAGEIVSTAEAAERRAARAATRPANQYIMCLVEHVGSPRRALRTTIDPTERGNVGRYLNHSCEPNLLSRVVRVGSLVPRLAFFTRRDVDAGEELTFAYGAADSDVTPSVPQQQPAAERARRPCRCGASVCTGWLPFDTSAET
jgi:histone-lysine N-methyltransferase SETMAR